MYSGSETSIWNKKVIERFDHHRLAEQIPLEMYAAEFNQLQSLPIRFDAFRDDIDVQAVRHCNDGRDDGFVSDVGNDFIHKRTVDFQLIER